MLIEDFTREMKEQGLSQAEVSRRLAVSEALVSLWLQGKRRIPDMAGALLRTGRKGKRKGAAA